MEEVNQVIDREVEKLYIEREKLALVRDIYALRIEIQELKNQTQANGNTDTKAGES